MTLSRSRPDEDYDNEKAQALIRAVIIGCVCLYLLPQILGGIAPPEARFVAYLVTCHWLFAVALYGWIARHPGGNTPRRVITVLLDLGGMTYAMAVGGAPFLPLYMIVIRLIVGNGLRYGTGALTASTVAALISIAVTTYCNAYWRDNPFVVLTLTAITLLVPTYLYTLLKRLRGAYAREQEANLSKSRFLAQASHDLRQPIHAISLFTACLRSARLGPDELQMVENIDRSLQSVSRLFKSLLDISTLDSGKLEPRLEPVSIDAIIEDVRRQNSEAALRDGTALRARPCKCVVNTDRALLTTMVQNIVNNAIKYAPGRPILIACRRRRGRLAIQVYDRGPGIAVEHQERVFDEFYRVRQRGDRDLEGVGLGLPIVRRLGTLLDLAVTLRSVPGRGTCVSIGNLPVTRDPGPAAAGDARDPSPTMGGLRVLLVEDDEAVLRATASLLETWGCRVQAESAIPDAVPEIDLLITDFELGNGVTGTECIAAVRGLLGRALPAVVISGHDATRVRADLGAPDIPILSKPVRPAELRSVLLAARLRMRPDPSPDR
ncbi:ATP-binding protein [Methylobacterium sp. J-026]|uniref:ATP-binding response regulator n=1 Tax=Methylobacterium sp. J-026 TaxID=2836624 RepID=UPI001FBB2BCA|nr:hybrid sensor histidine kinase/response regulator [Methylobacterium sp. J-026]MCJ2137007.1 ATP-binding protein [Methylobacterium sp. J-026]